MSEKIEKKAKDQPQKEAADNTKRKSMTEIASSPRTKAVETVLIVGGGITAATSASVLSLPILQAITPLSIGVWIILLIVGTFAVIIGVVLVCVINIRADNEDLHIYIPSKPKRNYKHRVNTELREIKELLVTNIGANVILERNHLTMTPNKSPLVVLNLLNSGGDIASNFEIKSFYAYLPSNFSERLSGTLVSANDSLLDIPKGNGKIEIYLSWDKILSLGDIMTIKAKRSLLFFYFEASYENKAGERVSAFKHCYIYDAELNGLIVAPKKYWPTCVQEVQNKELLPTPCPEITVRLTLGDLAMNQPVGMQFEFHNTGDATAYKLGIAVCYKSFTVSPFDLGTFSESLECGYLDKGVSHTDKIPMGDKKFLNPLPEYCPILTSGMIEGTETLFIYGVIWYEGKTIPQMTETYCRVFNPRQPNVPFDAPGHIQKQIREGFPEGYKPN